MNEALNAFNDTFKIYPYFFDLKNYPGKGRANDKFKSYQLDNPYFDYFGIKKLRAPNSFSLKFFIKQKQGKTVLKKLYGINVFPENLSGQLMEAIKEFTKGKQILISELIREDIYFILYVSDRLAMMEFIILYNPKRLLEF